ncbi:MAG: type III polyketide synthase, partial [Mycobacterium sp.]|nr:type III polyketide synthase [Mycobacterium sp.]
MSRDVQGRAAATPSLAAATVEFPPHYNSQHDIYSAVTGFGGADFERFTASSGVKSRHHALPLPRYGELSGFTEANDAFVDIALDLGERALLSAFDAAKIKPSEVDIIFSTTVTGLAVPTLEARLATRIGLRPDVKR